MHNLCTLDFKPRKEIKAAEIPWWCVIQQMVTFFCSSHLSLLRVTVAFSRYEGFFKPYHS